MPDYYHIIADAVSKLDQNTDQSRAGVYVNTRITFAALLRNQNPPLADADISAHQLALESAISRVEEEATSKARHNNSADDEQDTVDSVISIIERLLEVQVTARYKHPNDAFSTLMVNKLAAGYVFGFHDSAFKIFGLIKRQVNQTEEDSAYILRSYQHIFGPQAGYALFDSSLRSQHDPDFQVGRQLGGEDHALFTHQSIPPTGLGNILFSDFDAAAVQGVVARRQEESQLIQCDSSTWHDLENSKEKN